MTFGIVVFPGTNCERDCMWAVESTGARGRYVWHKETDLSGIDCVILAGGFSYGDYLRTGAIARFSPVMEAIQKYAASGGLVLGICNGFQILLESGLLPGAMLHNKGLKFICDPSFLKIESVSTPFTRGADNDQVVSFPINHYEGNYYIDDDGLAELEKNNQIIFRYCEQDGRVLPSSAPNGSKANIAGIANLNKNVLGLMPHPERAVDGLLGSSDGQILFNSIIDNLEEGLAVAR